MLYAYRLVTSGLEQMPIESDLKEALWIDLLNPLVAQVQALAALGVTVPTLADMEEIEVSNRLYREGDTEVLT
ncbi:MAG: magnesium transporter, partial [Alphaproteobacteria bacterium]|nr:magnesium transporter [Alphaproteobacteria bacterium]MBU1827192.1 magnesium transporter [Alphaproteobacteria bacterium]